MASLKHETIVTVTGADLRQFLTEEFCKSYNLMGELVCSGVRPVEGGDFELTLSPREPEAAPERQLQAAA